jgi:hypothetical protein
MSASVEGFGRRPIEDVLHVTECVDARPCAIFGCIVTWLFASQTNAPVARTACARVAVSRQETSSSLSDWG